MCCRAAASRRAVDSDPARRVSASPAPHLLTDIHVARPAARRHAARHRLHGPPAPRVENHLCLRKQRSTECTRNQDNERTADHRAFGHRDAGLPPHHGALLHIGFGGGGDMRTLDFLYSRRRPTRKTPDRPQCEMFRRVFGVGIQDAQQRRSSEDCLLISCCVLLGQLRHGGTPSSRGADRQASALAFACWNSSSVIAPRSRSSASRAISSAAPLPSDWTALRI